MCSALVSIHGLKNEVYSCCSATTAEAALKNTNAGLLEQLFK